MSDVISTLSERLIVDAKMIGFHLESVRLRDPARAAQLKQAIFEAIESEKSVQSAREPRLNVVEPPADDVEGLIIEYLRQQGGPQSVAQIHEFLESVDQEIIRTSLTVRLHRMAGHKKIVNVSRGHYALPSNAEGVGGRPAARL